MINLQNKVDEIKKQYHIINERISIANKNIKEIVSLLKKECGVDSKPIKNFNKFESFLSEQKNKLDKQERAIEKLIDKIYVNIEIK